MIRKEISRKGAMNMMEHNNTTSYAANQARHDDPLHQSRWFAVSGDIDDFIFYDETEDGYEHNYISEK